MSNNNIKNIRKDRGLSQKEVADFLNVSQGSVSLWEKGKFEPDIQTLRMLADLFGVSTDEILGRNKNTNLEIREETEEYSYNTEEKLELLIPLVFSIRNIGKPSNIIKHIAVPTSYAVKYGKNIVCVMSAGYSMSPTIAPGNYLVCKLGEVWTNDQIVVIDINDGETIKRIRSTSDGGYDLVSDNP